MTSDTAALQRFWELTGEANRVATEQLETDVEPWLEAVLSHVTAHPETRPQFADAFLRIVHENKGPLELVEYCMHALRWPEVKAALVTWLERENSERIRHALRGLIRSFDDDWHVANSYSRFAAATS